MTAFSQPDVRIELEKQQRLAQADCVHILEHVSDDQVALDHMRELLPPGGRLILLVPTVKWVWGTLDEATGHQRRYTWRGVKALLQEHGFSIEDHWYVNLLAILGWFFTGRILRRQIIPSTQQSLYNRITPLLARLETWIRPPIGLSVACVCSRRRSADELCPNETIICHPRAVK